MIHQARQTAVHMMQAANDFMAISQEQRYEMQDDEAEETAEDMLDVSYQHTFDRYMLSCAVNYRK